jgi:hypothetical protein
MMSLRDSHPSNCCKVSFTDVLVVIVVLVAVTGSGLLVFRFVNKTGMKFTSVLTFLSDSYIRNWKEMIGGRGWSCSSTSLAVQLHIKHCLFLPVILRGDNQQKMYSDREFSHDVPMMSETLRHHKYVL